MVPKWTSRPLGGVLVLGLVLGACQQTIPKEALQLSPESLERRQAQTRYFDTTDEAQLLSASSAVLQDIGFTLDESETDLGILVGSKDRDAVETGQVVGSIMMALMFGVAVPWDEKQKIRASVVTRPISSGAADDTKTGDARTEGAETDAGMASGADAKAANGTEKSASDPEVASRTAVRVTFQRIVWNTQGQVSRAEPLDEAEMYQEFFEKLSKSVFLEAHAI